jgi:ABC-type transporter Mla MlaB component
MLETLEAGHYKLHGQVNMQMDTAALRELLALSNVQPQQLPTQRLHLDVSALESADSVLLAIILELARAMKAQGVTLQLSGLSEALVGLSNVYGINSLIEHSLA